MDQAKLDLGGRRLVVIGGAGFIGSHVVDAALAAGVREVVIFDNFVRGSRENVQVALRTDRVRVIEGDIREPQALKRVLQPDDDVCHLAALWLLQCLEDPRYALDVNVLGAFNVIEACATARVHKLVFSSSASVYGNALTTPMTEDHPFNNRTFYGATKVAGEQFLRAFKEMRGLSYLTLRYMNVYGPRQDYQGAYVSVIMKVLDRLDAGLPPVVYGDGTQAYDFIYVGDVARANIHALASIATDTEINVGTGRKTSIREIVDLLLDAVGSSLQPEFRPASQVFVTDRVGSVDRARDMLGFVAQMDLPSGLQRLIEWRSGDRLRSTLPLASTK